MNALFGYSPFRTSQPAQDMKEERKPAVLSSPNIAAHQNFSDQLRGLARAAAATNIRLDEIEAKRDRECRAILDDMKKRAEHT